MVNKANWHFSEDVGLECEASNLSNLKLGILFSLLCKSDIYFYNLAVWLLKSLHAFNGKPAWNASSELFLFRQLGFYISYRGYFSLSKLTKLYQYKTVVN